MTTAPPKAPFPWYGGKSKAAAHVWAALGPVNHYVEPFAGSAANLLARPDWAPAGFGGVETINDLFGHVANFWRAVATDPATVARAASWPVSEADTHARGVLLIEWMEDPTVRDRLAGTHDWCDPWIAGVWAWCQSSTIAMRAGSGHGPWIRDPDTGLLAKRADVTARHAADRGITRERPHVSDNGQGVNRHVRQGDHGPMLADGGIWRGRPNLGNNGQGVNRPGVQHGPMLADRGIFRELPDVSSNGRGVNRPVRQGDHGPMLADGGITRELPHVSNDGQGVNRPVRQGDHGPMLATRDQPPAYLLAGDDEVARHLWDWIHALHRRLRWVRVLNGRWQRCATGGAIDTLQVRMGGTAGVFLDPPYSENERAKGLYAHEDQDDGGSVAADVLAWCQQATEKHPEWRIVLAGYADEGHEPLEDLGWTAREWYTDGLLTGGMGNIGSTSEGKGNQQHRERLWCSPSCTEPADTTNPQLDLFGTAEDDET